VVDAIPEAVSTGPRVGRVLSRYRRVLEIGVCLETPLLAVGWLTWFLWGHGGGGDFAIFRRAGDAVLHGHTPYVQPIPSLYLSNDHFVYPTPFALPFIPFALAGEHLGAVVFLILSVAALMAALWLLGVRDRRCYGVAVLGMPVFGSLGVGALGPILVLLLAFGWRYRDRTVAGVPLALAAAAKLFVWPVLVWLLVTRRYRAFAAALSTLGVIALAWLAIDPTGMHRYADTIRVFVDVQRWKSYSFEGLLSSVGVSTTLGQLGAAAAALAGIALIALAARERDERSAFSAAVIVALLATPILWLHYLALLVVPIALARPRLSPLWFLPVLLWVTPHPEAAGVTWQIVLVLGVIVATGFASRAGCPEAGLSATLAVLTAQTSAERPYVSSERPNSES
jgi:hypothetical protein